MDYHYTQTHYSKLSYTRIVKIIMKITLTFSVAALDIPVSSTELPVPLEQLQQRLLVVEHTTRGQLWQDLVTKERDSKVLSMLYKIMSDEYN